MGKNVGNNVSTAGMVARHLPRSFPTVGPSPPGTAPDEARRLLDAAQPTPYHLALNTDLRRTEFLGLQLWTWTSKAVSSRCSGPCST